MQKYKKVSIKMTPDGSIIIWRLLGLFLLCLLWLKSHGSEVGIVLLLFIAIMATARWCYKMPGWTVLIEQIAILITIPFWPQASFALALPLFEAIIIGRPYYFLLGLIWSIVSAQLSLLLMFVLAQAAFAGWMMYFWLMETQVYRMEADQQRRDRYELETLKNDLLMANIKSTRLAELSERNRISQKLHDDVGHELTASVLALQAFEQLWKEGSPQANDMFFQAQKRVSNSALYLRETVHNMQPVTAVGVNFLQEICDKFTACPIAFQMYGDTSRVPVYLWSILDSCLKEALTNVLRHSKATKVEITLDVNPNIVRLCVLNDGETSAVVQVGMGLRNLRLRARAVGGNVSIDASNGFRLICVLPLEKHF